MMFQITLYQFDMLYIFMIHLLRKMPDNSFRYQDALWRYIIIGAHIGLYLHILIPQLQYKEMHLI